jgi:ice-binding like protein
MRKFAALFLYATFSVCLKAQLPVPLGSAANFGVLAGSAVTNTGATVVSGSLGVSPGTSVSGFPPGVVNGVIHAGDATAAQGQVDLTTAYTNAAGRPPGTVVAGDIGGQTLTPGVYTSSSTLGITGNLTLTGAGVYIFQIASGLTTASGSQVILAGGATADNIFWQVGSSATLGTTSILYGDILAQASITENTGAVLHGRALARTGAVTLQGNTDLNPDGPGPGVAPAPSSLILVGTGLACVALYQGRKRLQRHLRRI